MVTPTKSLDWFLEKRSLKDLKNHQIQQENVWDCNSVLLPLLSNVADRFFPIYRGRAAYKNCIFPAHTELTASKKAIGLESLIPPLRNTHQKHPNTGLILSQQLKFKLRWFSLDRTDLNMMTSWWNQLKTTLRNCNHIINTRQENSG